MTELSQPPHLSITVHKTAEAFKHKEQEARDIFANHAYKENFFHDSHEKSLENFVELRNMGPHPLLDRQTGDEAPHQWIHLKLEAAGTDKWIRLFMRNDNLYARGFLNIHSPYEITEPTRSKGRSEPVCSPEHPVEMTEKESEPSCSLQNVTEKESEPSCSLQNATQLPDDYKCVPLHWDVKYTTFFGCDEEELAEEIGRVLADPDFAFNAVCHLSEFNHNDKNSNYKETRKILGGLIFLLCEFLRMNLRTDSCKHLLKSRAWGEVCVQLLKWRDKGFNDWITTSDTSSKKKKSKLLIKQLNDIDIYSPEDALRLVALILNRGVKYYKNIELNKPKKKPRGSDGGGKETKKSSQGKDEPGQGQAEDTSKEEQSDGTTNINQTGNTGGAQCAPICLNNEAYPLPYGRRRVQILSVTANFEVELIYIHDWHRAQAVYRNDLVEHESRNQMDELALIGPARAIGAYGPLGVEYVPTNTKTEGGKRRRENQCNTNQRGAIIDFWAIDCFEDEEIIIQTKEIDGPLEDEKISICYMLIPYAIDVEIGLELLLATNYASYKVTGVIKAFHSSMGDLKVKLFSHQTVDVESGQWASFPLMMTVLCLPYDGDFEVKIFADLQLRPSLNSEDECAELCIVDNFVLNQANKRAEKEVRDHKFAFNVKLL